MLNIEPTSYMIYRSPTDNLRYNVIAVDDKVQPLYAVEVDITLERATEIVEKLTLKPVE